MFSTIQTIEGVAGSSARPVANAFSSLGNGVQDGSERVAGGVKDAGQGKKEWF